jgi:asparagine synthase (glutamine-hydrolysing)
MSQAVREAGLTVALVGTGGDELFGGYTSFRQIPKLQRMLHATRWLSRSATAAAARFALRLRRGAADVPPQTGMAKLPAMIAAGDDLLALYQLGYALFLPDFQARLLAGGPKPLPTGLPASRVDLLRSEIAGHPTLAALSILEQRVFLGERLLRDSDAASMAVSLEMRLPLVDAELTRVVHGLPHEQRFHPVGRKAALRRAGLDGLDPNLFERPKSGFVLPYDRWIRQRLGTAMDEVMLDPAAAASVGLSGELVAGLWNAFRAGAPGLYWSRVWALYVLMRWSAQHGVRL